MKVAPPHLAVCISWHDAVEFMPRLTTRGDGEYHRLPTEAEWEYPCRAGTTSPWSSGEDARDFVTYALYWENAWDQGPRQAQSVATRPPNSGGLFDMHGNVWEWVRDPYARVSPTKITSLAMSATDGHHVSRGGNFYSAARNLRSAARGSGPLDYRGSGGGVRVLRELR